MTTVRQAAEQARAALVAIAASFAGRGWFPATSGNLSARISAPGDPLLLIVSASGRDKEAMTAADFVLVDDVLRPVEPGFVQPSAETVIHARIYQQPGAVASYTFTRSGII